MRCGPLGAGLWLALGLAALAATPVVAGCAAGDGDWVTRACYEVTQAGRPVYGHDVLGGTPEWDTLRVGLGPRGRAALGDGAGEIVIVVPESQIIEDVAPRLAQVDGAGPPEVVLVITDRARGAGLAVLDLASRKIVGTSPIGRRYRWLAPVGVADLDGDGQVELAYVDRPHLAKVLRVWRYRDGALRPVAAINGVSNHRIGERGISGGIRDCGDGPEIVVPAGDWSRLLGARLRGGTLAVRDLGMPATAAGLDAAMACHG